MLGGISQKIHDVQRLHQILRIFVKYGFGYIVDRLNIEQNVVGSKLIKFASERKLEVFDIPVPVRTRRILEELGPTFIKFGQILSTRPDLIPVEFCQEFEKLQNDAPPFEYEKVEEQIKKEFKKPVDEVFNDFSVKPVAAASLSQVHSAELKTGESVVVKVQRPDIKRIIMSDLNILYMLAKLAEKHIEESRLYDPTGMVDEFRKIILKEVNFNIEANNINRFRKSFRHDNTVYIPKVFLSLSTKKILTMERIEGIKVTDIESIENAGLDRKKIALNVADAVLKQIFINGFFHGDPHPGNILILEGNIVAFLDFGMVGRIAEETKAYISAILIAVTQQDVREITEAFISMGAVGEDTDVKKLNLDMTGLMDSYYGVSLEELKMASFLPDIIDVVSQNRVKIPSDMFLLFKALVTIEGVGRKLYPDFNAVTRMKPFVAKLIKQRYSPKMVAREFKYFIKGLSRLMRSLPKDLTLILSKIKKGTLRVEFEHRGLENLISQIDKVSNRISFSVIIAALIVGSSIIMQTDKGPLFLDFPILGILGFVVAAIMGLWLAVAILRSGRL